MSNRINTLPKSPTATRMHLRRLAFAAILSALSVALVMTIRVSIFPSANFLEYDPADIPILIGGILLGPGWALAITIVVSAIQALTVSAASGVYGFIMHVIATGTLVLIVSGVASFLRRRKNANSEKTTVGILFFGSILAALITTSVMVAANLVITPLFLGVPVEMIKAMIIPFLIPFNLIKLGGNTILAVALYLMLKNVLKGFER